MQKNPFALIYEKTYSENKTEIDKIRNLRQVFTKDGVVVGIVIRSVERYDQVKIKPTESGAEH